jgi:hypothetical protein
MYYLLLRMLKAIFCVAAKAVFEVVVVVFKTMFVVPAVDCVWGGWTSWTGSCRSCYKRGQEASVGLLFRFTKKIKLL